jgi:Na+:H+ antiporter, NhaA family
MQRLINFFRLKTAPGLCLCGATLLALILKNSPWAERYETFKLTPMLLKFSDFVIDKPLFLWVNDGLMAVFFLLVGLEIKRELLQGHLSRRDQIALPLVAAFGGMIAPACIYLLLNSHDPVLRSGWAVPMATDIAFALGILALLGSKAPVGLKIILSAAAILDDLGAIIVIALFYTADLSSTALLLALGGLSLLLLLNRRGVKALGPYMIIGFMIWCCVLKSGVHATLAGVALGLIIPLRGSDDTQPSPLRRLEHALEPWVAFFVLPLFAFVNAGLPLKDIQLASFAHPMTLGIILGLFLGKQLGVMLFSYVAVKIGLCRLPEGVNWRQYYGMALLMGIGFTMSLFIAALAFGETELLAEARLGVLSGSLLSAIAGVFVLARADKLKKNLP